MKSILEHNVSTLIENGGEPPQLSADARARIKSNLVERFASQPTSRSVARPLIAVGLGAFALAIAALLVVRGSSPAHDTTPVLATTKLADGTTYVADRGARVDVLGPRRVRVSGAVVFDVVPGKGRFVVETARGTIEVLGTKFVVDGETDETSAAVIRGEVKLATSAGDVTLHAGEQGIAAAGKAPVRSPAPRLSHLVAWSREARHADDVPVHHGTLFARDPGVRSHPPWGQEYPLPLVHLGLDVVVEDQVARVALDQTFHNDQPQELEGVYRFAIPADAALQRFAMYVDGRLEESAVVERMQARRIYEELVYHRVDPGLLEWAGTGRLSLRVYPIHANDDKRIVLAYTQSLPKLYDDYTLTIPLPETDQPVGSLDATVRVKGCANCELESPSHMIDVERSGDDAIVHYHHAGDKLRDSFVLHVRDPRHAPTVVEKTDGTDRYLMVRAKPELSSAPVAYRPRTWVILDDVSASRGRDELHAQRDLIDALVRELDENDRVSVVAFDVASRVVLPPTRTLDIDRRALRGALEHEGGVGATDFQVGLDAATHELAGVAPDDARIIYIGDGMITAGPRELDKLRAQIVGKARFVGIGVGDGPDTQTLDSLAAATGGYATTLDLADDLGWRAFDLVAALHTARVTNLEARLVDAAGNTVPATSYLGAPQLADGEELELVAKLAGDGTPAALELAGTQDGAPWHQRIALDGARDAAGYLPRLWAQRHIAARLLAKHEPVALPPCDRGPCPSEADAREARDEQIRREVVALGKRYFLLSRHTSLLVLENDAMYAQYGVTKGAGETWAPYVVPEHIAAHPQQIASAPSADDEIVRAPAPTFAQDQTMSWSFSGESGGFGRIAPVRAIDRRGLMEERSRAEDLEKVSEHLAATGASSSNEAAVTTMLPEPSTAMSLDEGKMGKRELGGNQDNPLGGDQLVAADVDGGIFGTIGHGAGGGGGYGIGGGRGGLAERNKGVYVTFGPMTFGANDFSDLTAFVPALFADDVDATRTSYGAAGSIDPAAQQLLAQARAALAPGVYRWGDRDLAIDARHTLAWRRTTDDDLVEVAAYDGSAWTRRYPELGLSVARAMPDDDVAIALAAAPLWIADPAHYAKHFDVTAKGRDVVLKLGKRVAFVMSFDAGAHLVALRDGAGHELASIAWGMNGPMSARVNGEPLAVAFSPQAIADAASWAFAGAQPGAVVTLPMRAVAVWRARLAAASPGSPEWRDIERQLLAAAAATSDVPAARTAFDELRAHGGIELGDAVLASRALAGTSDVRTELGTLADQPVGRYLAARGSHVASVADSGLLGALAQTRAAVEALRTGDTSPARMAIASLTGRALELRVQLARDVVSDTTKSNEVVAVWEACATGAYTNLARQAAVMQLVTDGRYADAANELARLIDNLDLTAPPPTTLAAYQWVFAQGGLGDASWQLVYARWRDRVLGGDSLSHVLALLPAAAAKGDLDTVLARALALAGDDASKLDLARLALQYNQPEWADRIVQPLVAATPTRERYQLAAAIALRAGRNADALADLEHAQDTSDDEPAPATEVRTELADIVTLAAQLAVQSTGAARDKLVAEALAWAARARAVGADDDQLDRKLGELLLAVGDRVGAWRQLSTAIERDPWSSSGYTLVADTFEHQGKLEDALPFWQQAIIIDQTNPTPRLRKAQALLALGRRGEADELLAQIAGRTWHDVWSGVVEQARELRARH
ncbi:MAG TPA: VIT domain-containing protein [Kofleriaceae bacterium]|jgi:tetratricopeptide (TPR) repeat protein